MSLLDKFFDKDKLAEKTLADPRKVFNEILKQSSGSSYIRKLKYDIFYQIYAFKGVVDGVGTSTLVANTALALADLGLTVCVIDTSVLQPTQDILLQTAVAKGKVDIEKRLDWFDMPYTRKSVLHVSGLNGRISVLSFFGKNRGITDVLSTNDNSALVEFAFTELHNKFDIILVDICHELTEISATCLQMSQQVIQVWNDSASVVGNIDNFITNNVTLACPLDKMRYVVYSKVNREVLNNIDNLLSQYRLKKLATSYLSEEISLLSVMNKKIWQYASQEQGVIDFTNCIIDIVCHICNIKADSDNNRDIISSNDVMEGKVEGTLTKKMLDENSNGVEVARTLEKADEMLTEEVDKDA